MSVFRGGKTSAWYDRQEELEVTRNAVRSWHKKSWVGIVTVAVIVADAAIPIPRATDCTVEIGEKEIKN